jgi:hypothetical protein
MGQRIARGALTPRGQIVAARLHNGTAPDAFERLRERLDPA